MAAQALQPDIAIQIDLMLAPDTPDIPDIPDTLDTPDMADRRDVNPGGGAGISLYSFHGRGTLNGVIPHSAPVRLFKQAAAALGLPLQRLAQVGVLADLSYVRTVGQGVASIDVGFHMRLSHSAAECEWRDPCQSVTLIAGALGRIVPGFGLRP